MDNKSDIKELEERIKELELTNKRITEEIKEKDSIIIELNNAVDYKNSTIEVIHEALHSGMWGMEFDEKGEMKSVRWSNEFRRMLGYKDETDFPDTIEAWSDRLYPSHKEYVLNEFRSTIKDYSGQKTYDVEYKLQIKDGSWHWYHAMGRLIRREDGTPVTYIGIFVDITEKKRQAELLRDALKRAEAANEAKSEFLSSMSHDIRTPMNGIIGMTSIAQANIDNKEKVEDCLDKISISSQHLLRLINNVLDMNKIESGKMNLQEENFDITELITEIETIIKPQVIAHKHEFVTDLKEIKHKKVIGDTLRIRQVLINL
nr:PAS domain-containing protein [Butyrivibrio sp.]